jgi:uncharacterized damage-inducible protein DinB
MSSQPEVWLRGPLDNIAELLQPVAHALLQAGEEVYSLMQGFPDELLWEKPGGLASPGFHLQHLSGVINRLFTYAREEQLNDIQLAALASEDKPGKDSITTTALVAQFDKQIQDTLTQLAQTNEANLTEKREVGRGKLPSTVIGLYVHAAEHTMRHVGQLLVTVKVLKDINGLQ